MNGNHQEAGTDKAVLKNDSSKPPPIDAEAAKEETSMIDDPYTYLSGFGNSLESEVIPGALPIGRNNPRIVPFGLYAEQVSGTAFTVPRVENRRTWLYRMQPSVALSTSSPTKVGVFGGTHPRDCQTAVEPVRWFPPPPVSGGVVDFVKGGLQLVCAGGDPGAKSGLSIYTYALTQGMQDGFLQNRDGDFLIVPQEGAIRVVTEVGNLWVQPREFVVIPRGLVFQVNPVKEEEVTRGYVLEVYKGGFHLPELGPIGANGLANARDFHYPTASCVKSREQAKKPCQLFIKLDSNLYSQPTTHSPLNVVAWHGNYLPFKYNLNRYCAVNSVSYDHLDPSIYTVLTCQSSDAGTALADFVVFPPRVMATDPNTLRPPYFHRNTMSEFMGLIDGEYDAKTGGGNKKSGFVPGGASLHNIMVPHGPDATSYHMAVADPCEQPTRLKGGMAFMFETCLPLRVAPGALTGEWRDTAYAAACWSQGLDNNFTGWVNLQQQQQQQTND